MESFNAMHLVGWLESDLHTSVHGDGLQVTRCTVCLEEQGADKVHRVSVPCLSLHHGQTILWTRLSLEEFDTFSPEASPIFDRLVQALNAYSEQPPAPSLMACFIAADRLRDMLQADLRAAASEAYERCGERCRTGSRSGEGSLPHGDRRQGETSVQEFLEFFETVTRARHRARRALA